MININNIYKAEIRNDTWRNELLFAVKEVFLIRT